jgi:hypothetical protein
MSAAPSIRYRPIFGGPFGKSGRYVLATMQCIERGLHSVRFMVVEPASGGVLSVANDKQEALAGARRLLRAAQAITRQAANDPDMHQGSLWPDADLPSAPSAGVKPKAVSRRRREVYELSEGRCHYCGTALTLDGKWHVEHMQARALGGGDELGNVVAACVPCNLTKGARTALEFITDGGGQRVQH